MRWAVYLGVRVGTEIGLDYAPEAVSKYVSRANDARRLGEGLTASIVYYNTRAVPVLSYIAQVRDLQDSAYKAEAKIIETIFAPP